MAMADDSQTEYEESDGRHLSNPKLFPDEGNCSSIVRLDLSRKMLTSLPKDLFVSGYARNLEFLDVSRNNLKGLPPDIGICKRLKSLIALSNNIRWSEFPVDAIASLPDLQKLDLRWNKKMNSQSAEQRLWTYFPADGRVELWLSRNHNANASDTNDVAVASTKKKLSACDRDANDLRSQLEPLSTPQLRKRLDRTFGISYDDHDEHAYDRDFILQRLLQCYSPNNNNNNTGIQRSIRHEQGVPLDPTLLKEVLKEMEAVPWPKTTRERPKINAEGYVILQRPLPSSCETAKATNKKAKRQAEKLARFSGIWTKALQAMESVDPQFAQQFTALAVTKNFQGSPHIDTLNIAPFYGLALGQFTGGGKLCVECSPTSVAHIDTHGKLAKVDGRFCHWVSDYVGTRYSLIYYVAHGEVVPQTTAIFPPPGVGIEGSDSSWVAPPTFVP